MNNSSSSSSNIINATQQSPAKSSFSQTDSQKIAALAINKKRQSSFWLTVNKYIYSAILLTASATIQFNFFGLIFFLLFIFHSFAYYSLRIYDEEIDVVKNFRTNKKDIRNWFAYVFCLMSGLSLTLITLGQCLDYLKLDHELNFTIPTQKAIKLFVPSHTTKFAFLYSTIVFILSIILLKTRKFEKEEATQVDLISRRSVEPTINIEQMKNNQIQRTVQLIKDYKFKSSLSVQLEVIILTVISSIACNVLVLPYIVVFLAFGLVMATSSRQKTIRNASNMLTLIIISLLLVDLPSKFIIKGGQLLMKNNSNQRYFREVLGLLSSLPTYLEFYLKIFLFLLECQKLQYSYDYSSLYEQIKLAHQDKYEHQRLFRKRQSFIHRIFNPISVFMFCQLAIIFALIHPSILFFVLLPLFIYGYFLTQKQYKIISKFIIIVIGFYILASNIFHIAVLLTPESQVKENYTSQVEKLMGLRRDQDIFIKIFPSQFDFLIFISIAFFAKFISKQSQQRPDDHRHGMDEDILTIPDDMSDCRSRISYSRATSIREGQGHTDRTLTMRKSYQPEQRPEEVKEASEVDETDSENGVLNQKDQKPAPHTVNVISSNRNMGLSRTMTSPPRMDPFSIQRDETLRGKMRRSFYKIYLRIRSQLNKTVDLSIIHSSKLALLALFCVSVSKATLFNCVLFLFFLALATASYSGVKKFWKLPIFFNAFIILTLYGYDIFAPKGIDNIDDSTLEVIGITPQSYNQKYLKLAKYVPYLFLQAVLTITYYVIHSQRYERFLQFYTHLEMNDPNEEEYEEIPQIYLQWKQQLGLSDPITKFIIKNSIYILVIALFVECSLLPVSVLNFILLTLMTIVVIKYFINSTQIQMYESLNMTLKVLNFVSLIFIFLKYMFQFDDYAEKIAAQSNAEARKYYAHLPLIEKLLGIENSYVPLKLFSLALVMVLSNLQLKFLKFKYLNEILKEEDDEWDRRIFTIASKRTKFRIVIHYVHIYMAFLIQHVLFPLPMIGVFLYSLYYLSIIGYVLMIVTILLMYKHRLSFWKFSYLTIGTITSFAILVIYLMQFMFLNLSTNSQIMQWIGIQKYDAEKYIIYDQLVPLFFILVSCAFQKQFQKYESLFYLTINNEEIISPENSQKQNGESPKFGIQHEQLTKTAIYEYESPIRHCLNLRDEILKKFFYTYGLIILHAIALITMLWKLNITSFIYSFFFVLILAQEYYPKRLLESKGQYEKRHRVSKYLKAQILTITAIILVEYFMSIGPSAVIDLQSWKSQITARVCSSGSEDCHQDWQQWLSISYFPIKYITLDFVFLFASYLNLYFTTGFIELQESQLQSPPVINDKNDFVSAKSTNKPIFIIQSILFSAFPYFLIFYLLIFAATFHGSGMSDLLSTVYLFLGFYYIVNFRKLYTKNVQLLKYLRKYNYIVLFAILIFQSPIFICPAVPDNNPQNAKVYINKEQCSALTMKHAFAIEQNVGNNPLMGFYIVLTQSIGLIKSLSLAFDLIIMILLTEIQNQLFNHPYYKVYVLQHMELEKQTDGRLRAFMFVERTHLNKLWSYKAINQEIKILHKRLLRINNAIRNSEYSKHLLDYDEEADTTRLLVEENIHGEDHQITQSQLINPADKDLERLVEKHAADMENLALDMLTRPETPVVPLKLFITAFKNQLMQQEGASQDEDEEENLIEEQLQSMVLKLQKHVHHKNRMDLYNKQGIGLNFAVQKGSSDFLKENDFSFYHHLILDNLPLSKLQDDDDLQQSEQEDFEVIENYEEFINIIGQYKDVQKPETSILKKLNFFIRSILWTKFTNKLLFYSLTEGNKKKTSVKKMPILRLIGGCILSQSQNICYFMIFINFIINANLISLVLPLSVLFYAMVDSPLPNVKYWKMMLIYVITTIGLKFLYQLPIFCGSPPYSLFSVEGCSANIVAPEILVRRIDYIFGIHKFAGPSSYPRNQGILHGIIGDLLVLFSLLLHKNYLVRIGIWHYVRSKCNIYQDPIFKCKPYEMSQAERINMIKNDNNHIYDYEQRNFIGKFYKNSVGYLMWTVSFGYKLLPNYMNDLQKNLDLRYQQEKPWIAHNVKIVKPGKDYFSYNFFTLLLILIYVLFFYRSVTGEQQTSAISSANLQRFSTPQVGLLFLILAIMMLERMLYRTRQVHHTDNLTSQSSLGKHSLTIKVVLHVILVLLAHLELGFLIPIHNQVKMSKRFALVTMYLLCILYFVSSAKQIKYGYPQAPFKPPFTRNTHFLKVWAFRIYKAVPFLWEMKVIIDWTVTGTCLDLFQWFKIDDAFNYLYVNQYQNNDRKLRKEFAQRSWYEKFFQGFCFAFMLILVILAPILLFSGINPIMVKNPVLLGQLSLTLEMNSNGNQYNILQTQAFNIEPLNSSEVSDLQELFLPVNLLFEQQDMQKMSFSPYSETQWSVSPPSLKKFVYDYNLYKQRRNGYVEVKSKWIFKRENPIGNEHAQGSNKVRLSIEEFEPIIDLIMAGNAHQAENQTINATEIQSSNSSTIVVESLFPKMLRLGSSQYVHPLDIQPLSNASDMNTAELTLNRVNNNELYWTFKISEEDKIGMFKPSVETEGGSTSSNDMVLVVYNEEVIGAIFGSALQLSVVGLYFTIVVAIGRFLRLMFDRISQRAIFEEMPNTEQLFEICEGIFIAQLEGDFVREKQLYDLLIRMYRSPETLIKITGAKLQYKQSKKQQQSLPLQQQQQHQLISSAKGKNQAKLE